MNIQGEPEPLRVMFAGYPSAGKTTAVCALLGAKVGQTSVDRATTEVKIFGDGSDSLKDDPRYVRRPVPAFTDDPTPVRYVIIDTPGVADAAEGANSAAAGYTGLAHDAIKIADVVLWLSPAPTAFLTRDEAAQFHSLVAAARAEELATGRLIQVGVLLTKYEIDDGAQESDMELLELLEGEVADEPGANSLCGRYEVACEIVAEVDPNVEIPVLKFSAHNRIRGGGIAMSKAARSLIQYPSPAAPVINGEFRLGWATRDLGEKRAAAVFRAYEYHYVEALKYTINHHPHILCSDDADCRHCVVGSGCTVCKVGQDICSNEKCASIKFGPVSAATANLLQMGGSAVVKFAALVATDPRYRVTRLAAAIGPLPDGEGRAAVVAAIEEAVGLPTIRLGPYEDGRSAVGSPRDPFRDDALRERAIWLAARAAALLPGSATALAVEVMASYKRIRPSATQSFELCGGFNPANLGLVLITGRQVPRCPLGRALLKVQERFAKLRADMWGAWENEVDPIETVLLGYDLLPLGVTLHEQPEILFECRRY